MASSPESPPVGSELGLPVNQTTHRELPAGASTDEPADDSADQRAAAAAPVADLFWNVVDDLRRRATRARGAWLGTAVVWIPLLAWFLGNRPGFMTFDSLDVWRQVTTGHWEDTHPVAYVFAMWVSRALIGSPSLLTLAQTMYMAAALALVARALVRAGCHRVVTYAVIGVVACMPQTGGFTIMLWKDVPYSAALLCVAARIVDVFSFHLRNRHDVLPRWLLRSLYLHIFAAVLLRQNGIFFAAFLGGFLLLVRTGRRRGVVALTALVCGTFVVLKLMLFPALGVEPTPAEINIAGFVHDIEAVLHERPDVLDESDRALLETAMPLENWRQSYYCYAIIPWYLNNNMRLVAFREHKGEFLSLWRKVVWKAPGVVISNRFCAAALAWSPQEKGYIYTLTYGTGPDALAGYGYGFKTAPVISALRPPGVAMLKWADNRSRTWFTWRAPFWIYLLDGVLLLQVLRFRRLVWLLPAAVPLAQQLNVTALNPSQDARYMFGALLVAMASLPLATLTRARGLDPVASAAGDGPAIVTGESDSDSAATEWGVGSDQVVVDGVDTNREALGSDR